MRFSSLIPVLLCCSPLIACGDDTAGSGGSAGTGGGTTSATTTTGTTTGTTTSTTTSTTTGDGGGGTTTGDGGGTTTGTGGSGQGGGAATRAPICTDVTLAPDNPTEGSCIELNDVNVLCNPVNGDGCQPGEACDISSDDAGNLSFICYPEPGTEAICDFCNEIDTFCGAGLSCTYYFFPQTPNIEQACAKYCCDDSECGSGVCQPLDPAYNLPGGLCLDGLL